MRPFALEIVRVISPLRRVIIVSGQTIDETGAA
jgi:hypothetical protein